MELSYSSFLSTFLVDSTTLPPVLGPVAGRAGAHIVGATLILVALLIDGFIDCVTHSPTLWLISIFMGKGEGNF